MDGPHLGSLGGRYIAERPKGGIQTQGKVGKIHCSPGTLYKRGFSAPILKCVGKEDANYILREVHEGVCGNHIGARTLAGKTLRQGYYWTTMLKDATELVRKCKTCQEHAQVLSLAPGLFSNGD